jgi:hypothetical protein
MGKSAITIIVSPRKSFTLDIKKTPKICFLLQPSPSFSFPHYLLSRLVVVSTPLIKNTTMKFAVVSLLISSAAAWSSLNMKAGKRYIFSKGLFLFEKVPSGSSTEVSNESFRWALIGLRLFVSPRWF